MILKEIKKNEIGQGLLIENDGEISIFDIHNKNLLESIGGGESTEINIPFPFKVSAVFQKWGLENANGRIYPKDILEREIEKYQIKIRERRSYGELNHPSECYSSDNQILTENGWKQLKDICIGENVLTLNTNTNNIEIQRVENHILESYKGKMIRIKGRNINDLVTPNHKFPIYGRDHKFKGLFSAEQILNKEIPDQNHSYIPKRGKWSFDSEEFFVIKGLERHELGHRCKKTLVNKYTQDLIIPIESFMKFMGIYLSEGDFRKNNYSVNITQKKVNVCNDIEIMLYELGLDYKINTHKNGCVRYIISDARLHKYVKKFGNCYSKYIPFEIKNQSKELLNVFYDWFVMGDGRQKGSGKYKGSTSDVFSVSKDMIMDLNEIQLKIGYSGIYHMEDRKYDRVINENGVNRLIKGESCSDLHFTYKSLNKGIYLDSRMISVSEEEFDGEISCVTIPNHTWYVMSDGNAHWTGNCIIDGGRLSHIITELHWEGQTLIGELELLVSPGFIKHGVISNVADIVANNIAVHKVKVGVSSRGLGSVKKIGNKFVVDSDFDLVCWDIVTDPSTPGAWIANTPDALKMYVENKESDKNKLLIDKLDKILLK